MLRDRLVLLMVLFLAFCQAAQSQEGNRILSKVADLQLQFFNKVSQRATKLNDQVTRQSEKYLRKFAKQEARLQRKLQQVDSTAVNQLFNETSNQQYQALLDKMKDTAAGIEAVEYLPNVDSLKSCLSFLQQNSQLLANGKEVTDKVNNSLRQVQQLQSKLQQTEQIKEYVRQRKQLIKETLESYTGLPKSITKSYQEIGKEFYYYSQQVQEYKEILNDPERMQRKLIGLLRELPAFKDFMASHSALANLFSLPGNYSSPDMTGLQTRFQVQQVVQNQIAAGGPNAAQMVQQNIQAAQAKLNELKDKLNKLGAGGEDMDMPDFKPNNQKRKSFLRRLEYGTNLQTAKANGFFPTTTDVGLSVGYKLNDKSTVGVGASYKVGWGKNINNIAITSEGVGLRSYLDMRIKKSFYASGGFEYNYQPLNVNGSLPPPSGGGRGEAAPWKQSGLLGISKIISLRSKMFKKTKAQLLWDFLSYQQVPRTQAIKFRIGYAF